MCKHHQKRDTRTDRGGKSRAEDSHVAGEDKEIISEHIENTACQHAERCKPRIVVITEKRRKHLIEKKQREHIPDGRI